MNACFQDLAHNAIHGNLRLWACVTLLGLLCRPAIAVTGLMAFALLQEIHQRCCFPSILLVLPLSEAQVFITVVILSAHVPKFVRNDYHWVLQLEQFTTVYLSSSYPVSIILIYWCKVIQPGYHNVTFTMEYCAAQTFDGEYCFA